MLAWYAVQVKRHEEQRTERYLGLKSISALLPLVEVVRRYSQRKVRHLEPLFPGYLFARMHPPELLPGPWSTLRWAPGVSRILGTDDAPVPVPDEVLETIKARMSGRGYVKPEIRYLPGSQVRVRHGPLAGLDAMFERPLSRPERVRVLLQLLGQTRAVELDLVDLEPS